MLSPQTTPEILVNRLGDGQPGNLLRMRGIPDCGKMRAWLLGRRLRGTDRAERRIAAAQALGGESRGVTDDELMIRGAGGDDDAFRVLVERWQGRILGFLVRSLGSEPEAEDVAQETFVRICRSAGTYRPEGRFASWLFRIAGNLARSRTRRRKILRFIRFDPTEHEIPEAPRAEQDLRRRELREALGQALDRLPERQREAFVLRYDAQLSHADIAGELGTTVSAVETLLHRAKLALRGQLGDWL
jgi:RNA polymerase sigma-70 factor (ECF subfamily)